MARKRPMVFAGYAISSLRRPLGAIAATWPQVLAVRVGDRVGIPWLGWSCGTCAFCRGGRENLCAEARFTGYTLDGGYAEYATAPAVQGLPVPDGMGWVEAAGVPDVTTVMREV